MLRELRPVVSLVIVFTLLLGLVAPLALTALAQLAFPFEANGSLIRVHGKPVGSALIGQEFRGPQWFHSRPSALTGTNAKGQTIPTPYDAAESGGSDLGPTSKVLIAHVAARIEAYRKAYGPGPVPDDAATSSGSGLDPDISLANALRQVRAVAKARGMKAAVVARLVRRLAARPAFGVIGTAHVDVLRLNLALVKRPQA